MTLTFAEQATFRPGQFMNLGLYVASEFISRSYSLASAPGEKLEMLLARVGEGALTPALFDVREGSKVALISTYRPGVGVAKRNYGYQASKMAMNQVGYVLARLPSVRYVVVASILADKDVEGMVAALSALGSRFVATTSSSTGSMTTTVVSAYATT